MVTQSEIMIVYSKYTDVRYFMYSFTQDVYTSS